MNAPASRNDRTSAKLVAGAPGATLRITVIGGGPVGLTFAAMVVAALAGRDVRVRMFDPRWRRDGNGVIWKELDDANRRRRQVITVQSRQYTLLPRAVVEHVFRPDLVATVWPTGSDTVDGLPPLNIRIADLEDRLLDWVSRCPQITLVPAAFDVEVDVDDLRGEHVVVVADGARSITREQLGVFGQPGLDAFAAHGRPARDVVLGLEVRSRLPAPAAVLLTLAQNRFLLNPSADGDGFLNMRLTDDETSEVHGIVPGRACELLPCTQRQPCFHGSQAHPPGAIVFRPSWLGARSALLARIDDGLRLFDVHRDDVGPITSFELSLVERARFTAVLFHRTVTEPATIATLLGDAAIAVHFWPGRGLNTGIGSAAALVTSIAQRWRGDSFRESDFAAFEARMAQLQFRNQTRGFYGCMRVDDRTGEVVPIRDLIARANRQPAPSPAEHVENCRLMADRIEHIATNLAGRLPGLDGSQIDGVMHHVIERLADVRPETVRALVASGPWDTYWPGGPEIDFAPERQPAPRASGVRGTDDAADRRHLRVSCAAEDALAS